MATSTDGEDGVEVVKQLSASERNPSNADSHTDEAAINNENKKPLSLGDLRKKVEDYEEVINVISRVLHLATANLTGAISNTPQREPASKDSRYHYSDEEIYLTDRISDLETRQLGIRLALESISSSLLSCGSRLPQPLLKDQIPDYFLRLTSNHSATYFDEEAVGFACVGYKSGITTATENLLPLDHMKFDTETYKLLRSDFRNHQSGDKKSYREDDTLEYDCQSPHISVTENPYRMMKQIWCCNHENLIVTVIDTRKLRRMGIHFARTTDIGEWFKMPKKNGSMANRTHWLVEHWIPAVAIVRTMTTMAFKKKLSDFDPNYKSYNSKNPKDGDRTLWQDVQEIESISSDMGGLRIK